MSNREQILALAKSVGMAGMITDVVTTTDELEAFYYAAIQQYKDGILAETKEPDTFPPLPNYLAKGNLGVCYYDGFQMRQYAMRYADKLMTANKELRNTLTMGAEMNTPDFLNWIADRLVFVYGENRGADFVLSLRERAEAMLKAIGNTTE